MVISGSGNDFLKGCNQIVADIDAVGRAPSEIDRYAQCCGRIIQSVMVVATIVDIVGCVGCGYDMVVVIAAVDRVLARSVRQYVVVVAS